MTFAICGFCEQTKMVGVAITSSSIAVGARCPWVRGGVGAVSTQNVTLPSIGPDVLSRLADGAAPQAATDAVLAADSFSDYRQVIAVDVSGRTASFAGANMLGVNNIVAAQNCVAAGNLLADARLPAVMAAAFADSPSTALPVRLLDALTAGLTDGGGEMGDVHSACLLVARDASWPLVDLRIDWDDDCPIAALRAMWVRYEPQMEDYATRARRPDQAPSYGVPGDE